MIDSAGQLACCALHYARSLCPPCAGHLHLPIYINKPAHRIPTDPPLWGPLASRCTLPGAYLAHCVTAPLGRRWLPAGAAPPPSSSPPCPGSSSRTLRPSPAPCSCASCSQPSPQGCARTVCCQGHSCEAPRQCVSSLWPCSLEGGLAASKGSHRVPFSLLLLLCKPAWEHERPLQSLAPPSRT